MIIEKLVQNRAAIEKWFEKAFSKQTPPFYASVDLRYSGFKLAPVDLNLYPAGFNNLTIEDRAYAAAQVKQLLHQRDKRYQSILLIIENHTRNPYYLENVATLQSILTRAGFATQLSTLPSVAQTVTTPSGQSLTLEAVTKKDGYLCINAIVPDCIILNNDLSTGLPELLSSIRQPILPPPTLGWYQRKKSQFFKHYQRVSQQFAEVLDMDDWLLNPLFASCDQVDFSKSADQKALIGVATSILDQVSSKYRDHYVEQNPYLVIKADAGSYGMGVLVTDDVSSISHLSRKQRQHMAKTKGSQPIRSVIVQEGIPTLTRWNKAIAEPVIYLIDSKVVGGFYRTHHSRNQYENLNTPGMNLVPASFHKQLDILQDSSLYAYGVVARLAVLAASFEMREQDQETQNEALALDYT